MESSFVAEVKSDLMGEQTILCGMLQAGSIICYDKLVADGKDPAYAGKLVQYGWETITEALKQGGITLMMDRLSNSAKLRAFELAEQIKEELAFLFAKHMDDIINGEFSRVMMEDRAIGDANLLKWREETGKTAFENAPKYDGKISEQEYFDNGVLMVAMVKAGVELAFDTMVASGIYEESAYYALHELPLIANTIARKRLYEMNVVISDTAEYGNYLFANVAGPIMQKALVPTLRKGDIGEPTPTVEIDNITLRDVNDEIRNHPVELIGQELRGYMKDMKRISLQG
ncbi:ketol-acid reductoisomerase [Aggregatibacter actinomycetemcomitans]|nr:ketol-acid reductoisomerase [Aggregatibacter actinomycetemcomitans]